eukprot:jgi/Psemu1/9864/gm1.9864_g
MVYVVLSHPAFENLLLAMVDIAALGNWGGFGPCLLPVCLKKGSGQLMLRSDFKLPSMPIEELADVDASQINEDVAEQAIACFESPTPQQMDTPHESTLVFFVNNEEVEEPSHLRD